MTVSQGVQKQDGGKRSICAAPPPLSLKSTPNKFFWCEKMKSPFKDFPGKVFPLFSFILFLSRDAIPSPRPPYCG